MVLEFTENEMGMIIGSLDFYMRMYIGQYREILFDLRWYRDCSYLDDLEDELRVQFIQIRNILLPDIAGYGWSGSYGIFNPDVECSNKNGKVYVEIDINNEHLEIISNALKINNAKYNCSFRELFSYYTKDEAVLRVADEITVVLKDIPEDKKVKYNNQEIDLLNNIRKQYDTIV